MFQRLRRSSTLLVAAVLPATLALAACGDDGGPEQLSGLKAVSISGEVGSAPSIDWKGVLKPEKLSSKVIDEGSGDELAAGDRVQVNWTLINGYTEDVVWDTYDEFTLSTIATVSDKPAPAPVDARAASEGFASVVTNEIKPGQKIGSRLAITVGSDALLEQIPDQETFYQIIPVLAEMGIGNEDGLLFVADLSEPTAPQGTDVKPATWAPKVVDKDGLPSALDFAGTGAPTGQLRVTTLVKGTGPAVKAGDRVAASYLGQLRSADKPFDESFSRGGTIPFVAGPQGSGVIEGWLKGLVGVPVGSRVILEIPPAMAYGKQAQNGPDGKVSIPANSTLYFMIDVVDVAKVKPAPKPEPAPQPTDQPTDQPSGKPTDKATGKATKKPTGKPSDKASKTE